MPLLSVSNVTKQFDGVTALDSVSFDIERGQIIGIIGPNGSGKTTLINLITGVYTPTSGDIRFLDESIVDRKPFEISRLGISRTFQNIRLFDTMSILDNVLIGADQHHPIGYVETVLGLASADTKERIAREEAEETVARVCSTLFKDCHRPAGQLAYADKRRVEIARALAMRPQLLLLDEPAAGMSLREIRGLIDDIKQFAASGITVLLVEHKMALIEGAAEKVLVFDSGQKIAEDIFSIVRKNPRVIESYLGRSSADAHP